MRFAGVVVFFAWVPFFAWHYSWEQYDSRAAYADLVAMQKILSHRYHMQD